MAHDRIDDFLEIHATLTPDQRADLADAMVELRDRRMERRAQGRKGRKGRGQRGEFGPRRGMDGEFGKL
jgi:hypothetical protein